MAANRTRDLVRQRVAASRERATALPVEEVAWERPEVVPTDLPLSALRFQPEQQPRDMLPPAAWNELREKRADNPAGTLEALRLAALERSSSRDVLEHVVELAQSIASEGVLVQLTVMPSLETAGDSATRVFVVLDGHCRAMASVIAERESVPVRVESPGDASSIEAELTTVSHRFLLNSTQKRLSPLEACAEVCRISDLARKLVLSRREGGEADGETGEIDELAADRSDSEEQEESQRCAAPSRRTHAEEIAREVREIVLKKTGLSLNRYHTLYRLRNLHPDARAEAQSAGTSLSEDHLRAIVGAPRELQPLLTRLVLVSSASVKETRAYCKAASLEGEEYLIARYAELLRRKETVARKRPGVSWEGLLRALPEDLTPRLSALRAELGALEGGRRQARLEAIRRQLDLLEETSRAFRDILDLYGSPQPSDFAPSA